MSLVYLSPQVHDTWVPLDFHGRSRDMTGGKAWDASMDEMGPHGYPEPFYSDARKFDSGGKPNPILLPMLRASMEKIALIDTQEAQEQLKALIQPLLSWASKNGYTISPGSHASHLIGIRPSQRTPEELLEMCRSLQQKGIIIAVRCGVFRISPYLTSTGADIQKLIEGLRSVAISD
jgi:selenocysteine lyase/cysteine desulfurase